MTQERTPQYAVEKSSILRDGERVFCLVRAKWGDEAPTWAALEAWAEELARLIGATADLLAALKIAVAALRDDDIDESMAGEFEVLTDAIAKAEGRET